MALAQGLGSSTVDWLLLLGGAVLLGGGGFIVGVYFAARRLAAAQQAIAFRYEKDSATDRHMILSLLQRELANWMLRQSPDRYVATYKDAQLEAERILAGSTIEQEAKYDEIARRHPFYGDFDLIGTREHVLYDDGLSDLTFDEVASHYKDIVIFNALQKTFNAHWTGPAVASHEDLSRIEEYIAHYKDGILEKRIKDAVREHLAFRKVKESPAEYENNFCKVVYIHHFAECRLGVHFKDTDEYGLRGVFVHDNGDVSESYYRTDSRYENERLLRCHGFQMDM